jgi:DNA repair exonuclease SbcCD nuclease subunit
MTTIIHCADLHLSCGEEKDYCLSVLEEIAALAVQRKARYLLICGDLFDSFPDAEAIRSEVRPVMDSIAKQCDVLFIPGNHDLLRMGRADLASLDLGAIRLVDKVPFELIVEEDVEFLCIPHQADYGAYHEWKVPARQRGTRIALAHALVSDMDIYAGPGSEEEGRAGAVDPDMFVRFEVDYAALGHIHARRSSEFAATSVRYPGSARVWRKGETGDRGVVVLEIDDGVSAQFVPLAGAGRYLECPLPLLPDGSPGDLDSIAATWNEHDRVQILMSGLVEDENAAADLERSIRKQYEGRVRRLDVDRAGVQVLRGISSQPIARKFLDDWRGAEPSGDDATARKVWLRAREMGLGVIRQIVEARQC